ncbi:MAG: ribbon-helix-helix protein, CopG family [Propionibacterium sp.]|nr:ribbon-helix-helix protein, CopG family [Propionibacterium sp.]
MSQVKLSVSISEEDVEALDRFVHAAGLKSRSAAIQQAIRRLGDPELQRAYDEAFEEWDSSADAEAWETVSGDGTADAAR